MKDKIKRIILRLREAFRKGTVEEFVEALDKIEDRPVVKKPKSVYIAGLNRKGKIIIKKVILEGKNGN